MWFIPSYILILFLTILIDFYAAKHIEDSDNPKVKKRHLWLGIVNTCLVLFVFKYFNFFVDNLNYLGIKSIKHWEVILPIGLSFHVFQSLSYVIEVYRGSIKAERNLLVYADFVLMFPQLVAGPIERANNLLPQLRDCNHKITYSDFLIGFSKFIWGLFKKVVVADIASNYVDAVYNNYTHQSGSSLAVGTFLFAIQIYCDFSGYSDMAIGVARMLGFRFKENFAIPYFSKSITEFWRRWHMSLSSWLRDYLYISFGGSRKGQFKTYRNLFLTMLIGGLWHGASWNFVVWGGLNGLFLSIEKLFKVNNFNPPSIIMKMIRAAYVFILINCTWVFFRATSFGQAMEILRRIFTQFNLHGFKILDINVFTTTMLSIFILFGLEYFVFRKNSFDGLFARKQGVLLLNGLNLFLILLVLLFGASNGAQFIYFQF
ncbi:MAG TPA: MBOAT family O-acyltransferase [Chitinophagaceae bacterium]|nr:MBOAT family O-acyltransferase [Chitinophagaceae bacterium]